MGARIVAAGLLLCGCVSSGWRFGPGFSCSDERLFAGPPVVEHRGASYYLAWTQGSDPFFFEPSYKAMRGRLVFSLVATASSGSLAGRRRWLRIEGAHNLAALQQGGAYWWEHEPAERLVRLTIVEVADGASDPSIAGVAGAPRGT